MTGDAGQPSEPSLPPSPSPAAGEAVSLPGSALFNPQNMRQATNPLVDLPERLKTSHASGERVLIQPAASAYKGGAGSGQASKRTDLPLQPKPKAKSGLLFWNPVQQKQRQQQKKLYQTAPVKPSPLGSPKSKPKQAVAPVMARPVPKLHTQVPQEKRLLHIHQRRLLKKQRVVQHRFRFALRFLFACAFALGLFLWLKQPFWWGRSLDNHVESSQNWLRLDAANALLAGSLKQPLYAIAPAKIREELEKRYPYASRIFVRRALMPARMEALFYAEEPWAVIYGTAAAQEANVTAPLAAVTPSYQLMFLDAETINIPKLLRIPNLLPLYADKVWLQSTLAEQRGKALKEKQATLVSGSSKFSLRRYASAYPSQPIEQTLQRLHALVGLVEALLNEKVQRVSIDSKGQVAFYLQALNLDIGLLDETVFNRVARLKPLTPTLMPTLQELNFKQGWLVLRWNNNVYLKGAQPKIDASQPAPEEGATAVVSNAATVAAPSPVH
jgi:hypothetical protein